jgi:hypothetical protein
MAYRFYLPKIDHYYYECKDFKNDYRDLPDDITLKVNNVKLLSNYCLNNKSNSIQFNSI